MITLTQCAEQCLQVLHALDRGELLMAQAADLLDRSVRQVRRLRRAYRTRGAAALVHGNRGRPATNRISPALRQRVETLARTIYADLNHQHFTELLISREGITLSRPSVRRILAAAGLRSPRRRRRPRHRRRRERMPRPGLLVQIDGSDHDWLQQRGPRLTLLAAVDDATGEVCAATFREEEDAHGYLLLLRTLTQTQGLPVAIKVVMLVVEVKGFESEQDRAKEATAKRWVRAMNHHGDFGRWEFQVCRDAMKTASVIREVIGALSERMGLHVQNTT